MFGSKTQARITALVQAMSQLNARVRRESRRLDAELKDAAARERLVLDRLARLEAKIEMLSAAPRPVAGVGSPDGFQSFRAAIEAESVADEEPNPQQEWATGFANRINEIWNDGVPVEELQRRQREWLLRTTKTQPTTDEEEAD